MERDRIMAKDMDRKARDKARDVARRTSRRIKAAVLGAAIRRPTPAPRDARDGR
jgi:hypothetical protein